MSDVPDPEPVDIDPLAVMPERPETPVPAGDHGGGMLVAFLTLRPFIGYFCWLADRQFPPTISGDQRVARLRERTKSSKALYRACVVGDVVVLVLATLGLLALAVLVAAKAVWPPPWLCDEADQ